jgi:predicted ABC-type ATPase
MPTLHVLGGANGVGKTTWHSIGVENGYINSFLPFINSDNIQKELGAYTAENAIIAEEIARNRMKELISEKKDFMIEGNLAKTADYDWINLMRQQGYQTSLFFLSTDDVDINKKRVLQRVTEGGHGVPEPIIEQRYRMGLSYLKKEILSFDDALLIDATDLPPKEMAIVHQGRVISKEQNAPKWVNEVLFLAERLQQKQQQSLSIEQRWEQFVSPDKEARESKQEGLEDSEKHDLSQRRSNRDENKDRGLSI